MNIQKLVIESIETKLRLAQDKRSLLIIENIAHRLIDAFRSGHKVLLAGNGGSAADAQHFAAELAGKFVNPQRKSLPAIALTTNTSNLTAIGNDFDFSEIFSRQIVGLGRKGDIFLGISTSGNSANIIKTVQVAKSRELFTIGLLGNQGGKLKNDLDISLIVPSDNTQNIQEAHTMIIHIVCYIIDQAFS